MVNIIAPVLAVAAAIHGGDAPVAKYPEPVKPTKEYLESVVPLDSQRAREIQLSNLNRELVRKGLRRKPGSEYRADKNTVCRVYLTHRDCWTKDKPRKHRRALFAAKASMAGGKLHLHHVGPGRIVPVPGFPGESASSTVIPQVEALVAKTGARVNDCFGSGHASPGHTVEGTACDFGGTDAQMDKVAQLAAGAGMTTLYDGRFGTEAAPGHGPSYVAGANAHVHVEFHLAW